MRKGKAIIGTDVLTKEDGRKVHTVKDLIIDPDRRAIAALLVDEGGFLSSSKVVPVDAIETYGRDAVVIRDAATVLSASDYPKVNAVVGRNESLIGKRVFTETGQQYGTISDIYFEEETGAIIGYEVTGGVFDNVTRANSYLPAEQVVRTGADVAYVDDTAVTEIQAGTGVAPEGGTPANPLLGRRPTRDIEDDEGRTIVASGQRIESSHIEAARERGKLDELTEAAGIGQPQGDGREPAVAARTEISDAAGSVWDQFRRKFSEMTDAQGRRLDEQETRQRLGEIEDAVGRPVTKVILDRQDNVILNLGDIITHQAVQQAYEAGALDSLLASVYRGEVAFGRDEMKAPVPGSATVEQASGGAVIVDEMQTKLERAEQERAEQKEQKRAQFEAESAQRERERQQRVEEQAAEARAEADRRQAEVEAAKSRPG
jgi:uncharacterized protein YrrD